MLATIDRTAEVTRDGLTPAECDFLADLLAPYELTPKPDGCYSPAQIALFESARAKIEARAY